MGRPFDVVLGELKESLPSTSLAWLMSLLRGGDGGGRRSLGEGRAGDPATLNLLLSVPIKLPKDIKFASLKGRLETLGGEAEVGRCTQLPLCKRISDKYRLGRNDGHGRSLCRSDSSPLLLPSTSKPTKEDANGQRNPFRELVGKIGHDLDPPSPQRRAMKREGRCEKGGVCALGDPITNPLYKVYKPQGQVKGEGEEGKEKVEALTDRFNTWLASLTQVGMGRVAVDVEDVYRLLRVHLEVPHEPHIRRVERIMKKSFRF